MIDYLKYRLQLRKLNKQIWENSKHYFKKIAQAEREKKEESDIEDIYAEWQGVNKEPEINRKILETNYLMEKAIKYNVPLPDINDNTLYDVYYEHNFLSDKGRFELNRNIRQEIKERLEIWIPYITVVIGLIGALIGLISVLK